MVLVQCGLVWYSVVQCSACVGYSAPTGNSIASSPVGQSGFVHWLIGLDWFDLLISIVMWCGVVWCGVVWCIVVYCGLAHTYCLALMFSCRPWVTLNLIIGSWVGLV